MIIIISFYLKNNDEITKKNISKYNKENNILEFNIENDTYNIDLNKFILIKDNSESTLNFKFNDKKETNGTYYIKDININIDARIKTNKLIYKNNKLEIDYELYLQDEYIGKFKLIIKE